MKCKTTRDLHVADSWQSPLITLINGRRRVAAGTSIDQHEHPETDCVRLVKNGEAVPIDDECRVACGMSSEQIDAAQAAQDKMQLALTGGSDNDANDIDT
jgi:hypothetical protein